MRDRLRRETATAHQRVDTLFGSHDLGSEEGYMAFLLAQARAWETLRPILDAGSIARSDALREDLDRLDLDRPDRLDVALPMRASLGHRYVLEGSRLGSAVLLRELRAGAPGMADRASAYLRESGKIEPWKQLSTDLQMNGGAHANDRAMIEDALFVFDLFEGACRTPRSAQTKVI